MSAIITSEAKSSLPVGGSIPVVPGGSLQDPIAQSVSVLVQNLSSSLQPIATANIDAVRKQIREKLKERVVPDATRWNDEPGIGQIFFIFSELTTMVRSVGLFLKEGNTTAAVENIGKLVQKSAYFCGAAVSLPAWWATFAPYLESKPGLPHLFDKIPTNTLAVLSTVTGIVAIVGVSIAGVFEILGIKKEISFLRSAFFSEGPSLKNLQNLVGFQEIQSWYNRSDIPQLTEDIQKARLSKELASLYSRLGSATATEEVCYRVSEICKMPGGEKQLEAIQKLTKDLKTQGEKKIIMHTLGLLAAACTIVALALSFACPALGGVILFFMILGVVLGLGRYAFRIGFMDQLGWKFAPLPTFCKHVYKDFVPYPVRLFLSTCFQDCGKFDLQKRQKDPCSVFTS